MGSRGNRAGQVARSGKLLIGASIDNDKVFMFKATFWGLLWEV